MSRMQESTSLIGQADAGTTCPMTMTYVAVPRSAWNPSSGMNGFPAS